MAHVTKNNPIEIYKEELEDEVKNSKNNSFLFKQLFGNVENQCEIKLASFNQWGHANDPISVDELYKVFKLRLLSEIIKLGGE